MKAQVLHKYDDDLTASSWVNMENVADPKIEKSSDVIVRIGGAGVCRTDLHIIEGVWRVATDPNGDALLPLIMGHENAGWIEDVGPEVEGLKKGDPVIVHPKLLVALVWLAGVGMICMAMDLSPALIVMVVMRKRLKRLLATLLNCRTHWRQRIWPPMRMRGLPHIAPPKRHRGICCLVKNAL